MAAATAQNPPSIPCAASAQPPAAPPTPPGAAVVGALGAVTVVGAREAMAPRPRQARVPGEKRLHLRAPPVLAPPPP